MNELKISIVVPIYNVGAYVSNCLDSILAQTYQNIEVLVVDDGSNDHTPKILDDYALKDSRIKVIHKENGGVTQARICGVAAATGDYIGFVDGDDYIEPTMFQKLVENAMNYHADISHCGYRMVFHNRVDMYYNTEQIVEQDHVTGLKDLLTGAFIEPGLVNKLFRRSLFREILQNHVMDMTIKNHEDLLMNFYLFRESQCSIFEDICPYHYLVRGDSAANKQLNENQLLDPIRVIKILMQETEGQDELQKIVFQRLIRLEISLATKELKLNPELIKPNRRKARQELRQMLPGVLKSDSVGLKLKIMALGVAVCPAAYQFVHTMYAKATGSDRKYDLG